MPSWFDQLVTDMFIVLWVTDLTIRQVKDSRERDSTAQTASLAILLTVTTGVEDAIF
jgi:hypothetical protein